LFYTQSIHRSTADGRRQGFAQATTGAAWEEKIDLAQCLNGSFLVILKVEGEGDRRHVTEPFT
jgi:hypothetical protein